MDKISVIIPTKHRPQDIMTSIDSIMNQTLLPDEIVIVDSSDTDELKTKLDFFRDKISIKYVHYHGNLAQSRNVGIDNCSGYIISFVDDDDILDKDYLREIKRIFDDDAEEKVGAVTGEKIMKLNRFSDRFLLPIYQLFARVFLLWRYGDGRLQYSGLPKLIRPGTVDKPVEVEYVVGYSMSFRSKVLREFGFDKDLPHFDDDDIAYRVSRKYKIIYTPRARYTHNAAPYGGHGGRIRRMMVDIREFHQFSKKNLPQTPQRKLAFYWISLGYIIRKLVMGMFSPAGLS
ncbi:glycosyltransferase family 2 protein [Chloroflexota bacterium]